jgi:hypothetical protein
MARLLVSVALAVLTILAALLLGAELARIALAMTLAVTGGIYVGFAISEDRLSSMIVESIQLLVFFAIALCGATLSWWFLVAGYFGHGLWDFAHHPHGVRTHVPRWYISACVVYDWLVGAFIAIAYAL